MPSLRVSFADRQRLADAESALFLVGGYDGSGNYGDVLQLVTAIGTAKRLPEAPLAAAIVEHSARSHHETLTRRYPEQFEGVAFAFFADDLEAPDEDLVELSGACPARSAVYVYGGGHMNGWWGARKVAHVSAAEQLCKRPLPVVASGLQVEEATIAPGGPGHGLISRAAWIGVRDVGSRESLHRQIADASARVDLAGDDAIPLLRPRDREAEWVVNLHLNDGSWVTDEPEAVRRKIVTLLRRLATASDQPLELQPVIAYEDPRISERQIVATLLARHGEELERSGAVLAEPLDALDDVLCNGLETFGRARLTVCCSYHVALTSLLAGIPAVLLAENEYYAQKAAGLRDLFELDASLLGARADEAGASAAAEALIDGPSRDALAAHLRTRSQRVVERFERGRATLSVALAEGLSRSAVEAESRGASQRATAAERELAAIYATRGWRALNVLRAIRDRVARGRRGAPPVGHGLADAGSSEPASPPETRAPAELLDDIGGIWDLAQEGLDRADYAVDVARELYLPAKMLAFNSWLELQAPSAGPLISVVLATRDRPQLLARAIPSVLSQRNEHWQLVVIDDGTDPDTRAVVGSFGDERVLLVKGPRRGLSAARNAGLDRAGGEIVCYLDDDNVMHPGWLQAVAYVFASREDVEIAYGITLAEHRVADDLGDPGWWPSFWQLPWQRETLLQENVTDAGALAHRRDLAGARFDESLTTGEDWDLLLRLTAERNALAVPALSHAYAMDGVDRMSRDPRHKTGVAEIRRRYEVR